MLPEQPDAIASALIASNPLPVKNPFIAFNVLADNSIGEVKYASYA
jgi:hypothetical protein